MAQQLITIRGQSCLFVDCNLISGEGRHYLFGEQADGIAGRLRVQVSELVTGAKNVVADQLMLFLQLARHRLRTSHQSDAVVHPEVEGVGPFPEGAPQFRPFRRPGSSPLIPPGP